MDILFPFQITQINRKYCSATFLNWFSIPVYLRDATVTFTIIYSNIFSIHIGTIQDRCT